MIVTPVLICQGFQQAFVEPEGALFSASASIRRTTCENLLRHARRSGWTVIHAFLDSETVGGPGEAAIHGFSPLPSERYFWQGGLSPFSPSMSSPFERALFSHYPAPVFLMSLAGLRSISATLLAGLERHYAMHVVIDAVADTAGRGMEERERIRAIETLARDFECAVTSAEVFTLSPAPPPLAAPPQLQLSEAGR